MGVCVGALVGALVVGVKKAAIFAYYRFLWRSVQSIDEDKVMQDLPPVMQLQIDIVATKSVFSRITLFRFFPMEAILTLVQRLQPVLVLPNETIIQQGQVGIGLFFIIRGHVNVWRGGMLLARLKGNDHFGERSLLTENPVEASVISETFSDLMLFDKEDVQEILRQHPEIVQQIFYFAARRTSVTSGLARRSSSSAALERISWMKEQVSRMTTIRRTDDRGSDGTLSRMTTRVPTLGGLFKGGLYKGKAWSNDDGEGEQDDDKVAEESPGQTSVSAESSSRFNRRVLSRSETSSRFDARISSRSGSAMNSPANSDRNSSRFNKRSVSGSIGGGVKGYRVGEDVAGLSDVCTTAALLAQGAHNTGIVVPLPEQATASMATAAALATEAACAPPGGTPEGSFNSKTGSPEGSFAKAAGRSGSLLGGGSGPRDDRGDTPSRFDARRESTDSIAAHTRKNSVQFAVDLAV